MLSKRLYSHHNIITVKFCKYLTTPHGWEKLLGLNAAAYLIHLLFQHLWKK